MKELLERKDQDTEICKAVKALMDFWYLISEGSF